MTPEQLQVIRDYVNAAIAADPVNWVNTVTQRMDEVGVSPAMLQQAFPDLSVAQIQAAYNQARPTGAFATTAQPNLRGQATGFAEGTGAASTGPVGGTVRTTTPATNASNSITITPGSFNPAGSLTFTGPVTQPAVTPVTQPAVTPVTTNASRFGTETVADLAPVPSPVTVPGANVPGGYTPLPAAPGESRIDPIIQPYLADALGKARSLFEMGQQPQLYPGQMFVSPSAETLSALEQQTGLAEAAVPFFQQAAAGLDIGQRGLQQTALGGFLSGSPYRDAMIEAATRPLTQQFTEQVMPGIQSQFSQAGRLGSGAQAAVTGRATEGYTRALGDVTSQIAAQDYARERAFQEAALRDVMQPATQMGNIFSQFLAPSQTLANVGAQREAIAGQPLAESIRRFEYAQNLPQQQFANYMAAIYGSPLGGVTGAPQMQSNTTLQNIGGLLNTAAAIPSAISGIQSGISGIQSGYNFLGGLRF